MEELMSRRKLLKTKLTRIKNKLDAHTESPIDLQKAKVYEEQINEMWEEQNDLFSEILSHCDEEEESEYEQQFETIAERMDDVKVAMRCILEELTGLSQHASNRRHSRGNSNGASHSEINMKLPKLDVPRFSGNILEWTTFSDLYTSSIHNHPSLRGSQKLQYLKTALSGEAATLLDSFPISDANYSEAWDTLKRRYQNIRELVRSHLQKFMDMPFLKNENATDLRRLVDTSASIIRALKALKRPISDDCDLAMYVISTRVDPETTKLWESRIGRDRIPKLQELLDFLDERSAILTSSESGKYKQNIGQQKQNNGGNSKKAAVHQMSSDGACVACSQGSHPLFSCKAFLDLAIPERRGLVKKELLCFNCLKTGHNSQKCFSKRTCKKCEGKHNTLLHLDQPEVAAKKETNETTPVSAHTTQHAGGIKRALLSTALVMITDAVGQVQTYRALLDPGGDVSCVSERCVQQLGIARSRSNVQFSGLGSASVGRSRGIVNLSLVSRYDATFQKSIEAYVLSRVKGDLPKLHCTNDEISHFSHLKLADPYFYRPGAIDLLLGSDVYLASLRCNRFTVRDNLPVAHETAWGWIIGGECPSQNMVPASVNHLRCEDSNLDEILTRFWHIEEIPKRTFMTVEEKKCDNNFVKTTTRDKDGRFVVELPFKENHAKLGASRDIAVRRLRQMERSLQRKPEHIQNYIAFMQEYQLLGHMELVPPEDLLKPDHETCYIPHHAITTSKFRVVFDASSKTTTGTSLNDTLMTGPKLQDDLFVILVRFRMYIVAFTADIVKMFRQIWVAEKHRDYQRIVWRDSPEMPIKDFRLTTVTYGTSSAPYLSKRCLQLLSDEGDSQFPIASKVVGRDYYMDDLMSGEFDIEPAKIVVAQTLQLMQSARMDLRKWSSCSEEILEGIDSSMRAMQTPFRIDEDDVIKTLGLYWLPSQDLFWFKVNIPPERSVITKRTISSDTSKVFDPLGLLAPVTLVGKILMQKLWMLNQDWDEPAPESICESWSSYRMELAELESIKIHRCIKPFHQSTYDLIGFSDASETASGAVVYCRSMDSTGSYLVRLVAAKTKVAPLQQKSLPRLELNGAVLLAHLMSTVSEAFLSKPESMHAFTDSTVVLAWLKDHPKRWNTYVANRVSEIQELLPYDRWHHVQGTLNPADCASRGLKPSELVNHDLWWEGPEFLRNPIEEIPRPDIVPEEALREMRRNVTVMHTEIDTSLLHRFSSFTKHLRVTAYCKRFSHNTRNKKERKLAFITSDELRSALFALVQMVQQESFGAEMELCMQKSPVSAKSRLRSLNPFLDEVGLLRVGGRLRHSKMEPGRKHPLILPNNHAFTKLIIEYEHLNNMHGGCQNVLASIHRKFWILNGRDAVSRQIRRCVRCCRVRAQTATQMMGDLPYVRVIPHRAFLKVGVDYAGPILLRRGKGNAQQKGYITIFICMVTRAMHLEVVTSLTSEAFIAVLKRFVSRRGLPSDIFSDCGKTFVGSNKELQRLWKVQKFQEAVGVFLAEKQIRWHFNPPASPHFGGLWEAGIRSVKFHLHRTIGNVTCSYEDMCTMTSQIEACLNSRPLTQLSSDPNDLEALTPGHFLIGDALTSIPEPSLHEEPESHLTKWKRLQRTVQHFWKRWSKEYLSRLQQRPKWLTLMPALRIGDLVLLKDERLPPLKWTLARIVEAHPGPDGIVRVYTVKTAIGILKRPLVKLSPLPIDPTED